MDFDDGDSRVGTSNPPAGGGGGLLGTNSPAFAKETPTGALGANKLPDFDIAGDSSSSRDGGGGSEAASSVFSSESWENLQLLPRVHLPCKKSLQISFLSQLLFHPPPDAQSSFLLSPQSFFL